MNRRALTALVVGLGAVVLLFMLGIGLVAATVLLRSGGDRWNEHVIRDHGAKKVAVIDISGEIHGGESTPSLFGQGGAGSQDIISQLRQAEEDDRVSAIILRIDTPGGAVVASDEIAAAVRRVKATKLVLASMGDMATSGGYYIASQANRIFANRGTITGSIGVIAVLFNLEGAAQKLGVKPIVLKSGALKDASSPFRELGSDQRAVYQRLLDESFDQFVETVASGRKMKEGKVRKLADGRPYSGADAKKFGLIDEFGDLDAAYAFALRSASVDPDQARLVRYEAPRGFGGLLPFGFGSAVDEVKRELGFEPGLKYMFQP